MPFNLIWPGSRHNSSIVRFSYAKGRSLHKPETSQEERNGTDHTWLGLKIRLPKARTSTEWSLAMDNLNPQPASQSVLCDPPQDHASVQGLGCPGPLLAHTRHITLKCQRRVCCLYRSSDCMSYTTIPPISQSISLRWVGRCDYACKNSFNRARPTHKDCTQQSLHLAASNLSNL